MFSFLRHQEGQTLVETIIAVTILLAGIVTSLTLGIVTIRAGQVSQSRTVADNLAREGLELVRNMRDSNWLLGNDWDEGFCGADTTAIPVFMPDTIAWSLDFTVDTIDETPAQVLLRDDTENPTRPLRYYMQTIGAPPSGSEATPFRRLITLSADDGACAAPNVSYTLKVEVEWDEGDATHSSVLEEQLYDWRT